MPNKSAARRNKAKNNNKRQGTVENVKSTIVTVKRVEIAEKKPVASNITLAGLCAVCWQEALYYCTKCKAVGYCCMSHMATHSSQHDALCNVLTMKLVQNAGWLYGCNISTPDEWRYTRIKTMEYVTTQLKRNLDHYERDLLLFPKHCTSCYETRHDRLVTCKKCYQVWYCRDNADHLAKNHSYWCAKLQLFATLVRRQAAGMLYMFDMNFGRPKNDHLELNTNDTIEKAVTTVLYDSADIDECKIAMISQGASGPLTILYGIRISKFTVKKNMIIHLIGAELHYEGSTLQAWETFFMHFIPEIVHLKIIMIGPELNATVIHDRPRLCDGCRSRNKSLSFEYKDGLLYHEYVNSKFFTKPDLVCAFNPGLHRCTGFNQDDTWPQTIRAAVSSTCPFIFTAYTAYEAPLDLKRVQESCAHVHIIQPPIQNPFASLKPDRNFISDHEAPLIYKNYYMSIVTGAM
ncbi:uncharacterized protein CBL_02734 [Carabus blaptoides fortunei]